MLRSMMYSVLVVLIVAALWLYADSRVPSRTPLVMRPDHPILLANTGVTGEVIFADVAPWSAGDFDALAS